MNQQLKYSILANQKYIDIYINIKRNNNVPLFLLIESSKG